MLNKRVKPWFRPGSPIAAKNGCTCAVLDNGGGAGYLGDGEKYGWWVQSGCPLHAPYMKGSEDVQENK